MPVTEAAKEVSKAVSNDIAVIRTRFDIESGKGRKKRLTPVEAELHVNPVSIAVGAATVLLGALAGTIAWQGIHLPNPFGAPVTVVQGMKDTGLGKDINAWYERMKHERVCREAERKARTGVKDFTPEELDCLRAKAKAEGLTLEETIAAFDPRMGR